MDQESQQDKKYIKIYQHKLISYANSLQNMLHLEDIAPAVEIDRRYKILAGKYASETISGLDENYAPEDLIAIPLTKIERNLITEFSPEKEELYTVDNYLKHAEYQEYLMIIEKEGNIQLLNIIDENLINAYKEGDTPSEIDSIFCRVAFDSGIPFPEQIKTSSNQTSKTVIKNLTDYKIEEVYQKLRKKIVGLDDELKILLANITKNISLSYAPMEQDKINELKSCPLIIGPTGTGKTFMMKSIAESFDTPIIIEDATRYTPAAYKGADIDDILINMYHKCGDDPERFEHSIVFIDEIDKICKFTDQEDYKIKESTQNQLLTLISGITIPEKISSGFKEKTVPLNTSKMTFVFAGAFEELADKKVLDIEDLVQYGMIRQLAGRMRTKIRTKEPTAGSLKDALINGEYSYINLLKEYLSYFNIELSVDESFIDYIVKDALDKKIGYRGLSDAITEYLNPILFDIYAGKLDHVHLSKDTKKRKRLPWSK